LVYQQHSQEATEQQQDNIFQLIFHFSPSQVTGQPAISFLGYLSLFLLLLYNSPQKAGRRSGWVQMSQ